MTDTNIQNYSLNDFRTLLAQEGVARDNQFYVEMVGLNGAGATAAGKIISLFAHAVSIPPRNILTSPYRIEHAHYEMPYGVSYEPISITFYLDRGLKLREYFVSWMEGIHSNQSGMGFFEEYTSQLYIYSLDKQLKENQATYKTHLMNVFPKSISEVQYTSNGDGVASITVQFAYERIYELRYTDVLVKTREDFMSEPFPYPNGTSIPGFAVRPSAASLHTRTTNVVTNDANKAMIADNETSSVYYGVDASASYVELGSYDPTVSSVVDNAFASSRIRLSNKKSDVLNRV